MKFRKMFESMNKNQINHFTPPYGIRNDCKLGTWKTSDTDYKGNSLKISILETNTYYGKLGMTTGNWVQIWFIAAPGEKSIPQKTVCCTYIKGRSASSFSQKLIELCGENDPMDGIFTASFESHQSDLGKYYSLKWDWSARESEEEIEQAKLIEAFLDTNPLFVDTNIPDTMVELTDSSPEQIESAKQLLLEASNIG